ncbi:hypothetical protein E1A91_D06G120500v1 [Gossypium mustelinum]|uniref:Uncharacterized protein n=1 Tax=Gossypium mustelinum TaxID=34275 RepID=A0A5D2UKN0_GOSMU|nr:hypothetical protein E1A91_D06G120500v1 [Gossypium mustelinum]
MNIQKLTFRTLVSVNLHEFIGLTKRTYNSLQTRLHLSHYRI